MRMTDLILKKRDGFVLSPEEIRFFVEGVTGGTIPDYQTAAFLMAVYFQGMDRVETIELVKSMMESGSQADLSSIPGIKVDKHSTGGVGDKTSIVLAPLVAAAGVPVAKMSGRGLGHTGGTIDKLEAFPGIKMEMDPSVFIAQVKRIGIAIAGQSGNLAPADKKLYALRDVTGTVENLSLISGSIMSKKLASGADAILLDVKTGSGSFIGELERAKELARIMVDIGEEMGRKTVALITDMDQPLGFAVGNSLEVQESIQTLSGNGPEDLEDLCIELGAEMLVLGEKARSEKEAKAILQDLIKSGDALKKLADMVSAQGGNPDLVYHPENFKVPEYSKEIVSLEEGFVSQIVANKIGLASMKLGAGRERKEDAIDLQAGVLLRKKLGQAVKRGETIAVLFSSDENKLNEAATMVLDSYSISDSPPKEKPLVYARVDRGGIHDY